MDYNSKNQNDRLLHQPKNRGFGIVEVMVAMGLLSIVSYGIMAMLENMSKSQRGGQAKDNQREVISEIRTLLNNKTACLYSFGAGAPATPFTVGALKDALNVNKYALNDPDKSGLLKYKEFKIQDWAPDAGYTDQGIANLNVLLTKQGNVNGVLDIAQKIALRVKTNAAGTVSECFAIGASSDGFWQASPINVSNIYFAAGKVGIGMDNPQAQLEVAGSIKPGSVALGAACSPEGAIGYDPAVAVRSPVFCNYSGVWAKQSSTVNMVFFDPKKTVSTTASGGVNTGWITYNVGAAVPAGTAFVIIETHLRNNWRVGGISAMFRKNASVSAGGELWLGESIDDDSRGGTAGQGIYPIDTSTNSFQFRVDKFGDGGTWEINIIGYIGS